MDDIRAVMDAAGTERAVLLGIEDGFALDGALRGDLPGADDRVDRVRRDRADRMGTRLPVRRDAGGLRRRPGRHRAGLGDARARGELDAVRVPRRTWTMRKRSNSSARGCGAAAGRATRLPGTRSIGMSTSGISSRRSASRRSSSIGSETGPFRSRTGGTSPSTSPAPTLIELPGAEHGWTADGKIPDAVGTLHRASDAARRRSSTGSSRRCCSPTSWDRPRKRRS